MRTYPAFLAAAILVLAAVHLPAAEPMRAADARWNILFLFADDWGRFASAYRGLDGRPTLNDVIHTPNIDRVAREGVIFRNAYVQVPTCTPSRSSLLSGRHFFNTGQGAITDDAVWDPAIPSYPLLLRDAGYTLGKSYKVWSPGTPRDAPFGGNQYAFERHGSRASRFSQNVTSMVESGQTVAAARQQILDEVRGNFDDFLATTRPGQPWHYFFGPTNTHRFWTKGSGKKLWGIDPDSLRGRMPAFLPDVPEVREDVADYLGECQAVDAYLGALLQRLEQTGQYERTLIVLSGDHGMPGVPSGKANLYDHGVGVALIIRTPGGKAGRIVDDMICLPDLAPTFMEVGGVTPPAGLYGRSLMPILRSEQSGIIDPTRDHIITGRERHVAIAREGNLPYPMRSLRTREHVYIRNFEPDRWPGGSPGLITETSGITAAELETNHHIGFSDMDAGPTKAWLVTHRNDPAGKRYFDASFGKRPAEELYDLRRDPDQVRNVASDPEYAAIRTRMAAQLMQALTDARDPRVTGDGKQFDRPPFVGDAFLTRQGVDRARREAAEKGGAK
jgi:uncharacterized sulfatase